MNAQLKRLHKLADDELFSMSEAIESELDRRLERMERFPESAKRRAGQRGQSYRQRTGSSAPPIAAVGLGKSRRRPLAVA